MINRLIQLNSYTSKEIYSLTGQHIESPILLVGNNSQRIQIEKSIRGDTSTCVVGPPQSGKLTMIKYLLANDDFVISYDGSLFGMNPIRSSVYFIIRNPKSSKLLKKYASFRNIVVLYDDYKQTPKFFLNPIHITPLTTHEIKMYERRKGYPFPVRMPYVNSLEYDKVKIMKLLRGKLPKRELPTTAPQWISQNFFTNRDVLEICNLAQEIPAYQYYLLNLIRVKRNMKLNYPRWSKRKQSTR